MFDTPLKRPFSSGDVLGFKNSQGIWMFLDQSFPLQKFKTWAETQELKGSSPPSINLYYGAFCCYFQGGSKSSHLRRPNCAVRFHWRLLHHRQYRRASQGLCALCFFRGLMGGYRSGPGHSAKRAPFLGW